MALSEPPGGALSGLQGLTTEQVVGFLTGPTLASIWEQFSGETILSDLRDMGLGMRTQDFYDLRRTVLGLNKWQEPLQSLDNNILIPRAWMVERDDIDLSNSVLYRFAVSYIDTETDTLVETVRAISSDRHYTKQELYDDFTGLFGSGMQEYGLELQTFELKSVWTKPGAMLVR